MSKWIAYDGYTKVKMGNGRHARFVVNHIYKCPDCGWSVRIERTQKPPRCCPNCQKDMKEGE